MRKPMIILIGILALPSIHAQSPYDWIVLLEGRQLFVLLLLLFLIFVIVFELLARVARFHRGMSAVIALVIAIAAFALKQTQDLVQFFISIGAGLGALSIAVLIALAFIAFMLMHLGFKRPRFMRR